MAIEYLTEKDGEKMREAIKVLEQEPCNDEYIKVPKKALKYRTAGMVAYNAEWLKNHFDIERTVICGAQEPKTGHWSRKTKVDAYDIAGVKTWGIKCQCDRCDFTTIVVEDFGYYKYCPNCGAKMIQESEK